jgi:DNA-binding protein H-NS
MPRGPALKSMSVDKLVSLRGQVEAILTTKVAEERRSLQAQLGQLERYADGGRGKGFRGGKIGSVAPKYRNPDNPAETWAGRGLKPRWLAAAIKGGKKLEHFAIDGAAKASATTQSKTTRKVRKS